MQEIEEMWVWSLDGEDSLEEDMLIFSNPCLKKSHGWRSLVGYSPKALKETRLSENTSPPYFIWISLVWLSVFFLFQDLIQDTWITFHCHISWKSYRLWQFLRHSLFLSTLIVLRTGWVFGRMYLHWDLCLFFSRLDCVYGCREEDHRGEVSFSSEHNKGTYCQHDLALRWSRSIG